MLAQQNNKTGAVTARQCNNVPYEELNGLSHTFQAGSSTNQNSILTPNLSTKYELGPF